MNPVPTWGAILKPDLALSMTLNLQFAIDRAYVARRGPLPTFTNATTTARTYVGSNGLLTTAATDVPRIEFDPITGQCLGLLIEEQRQNLVLRSAEFSTAPWTNTLSSITANIATSPDGSTAADKLVDDATANIHTVAQTFSTVSGTTYTFSLFIKAAERTFAAIGLLNGFPNTALIVNLSTGAVTTGLGTPVNGNAKGYPGGWYRVSFSVAANATTASASATCYVMNGPTWADRIYAGNGTSGILIWGAQVEVGAFPTSYIPTTTGPLVRSADVCSITGAAFTGFYNQTEGAMVLKMDKYYPVPASIAQLNYLTIGDGTLNNYIQFAQRGSGTTGEVFRVESLGSSQCLISGSSTVSSGVVFGIASRYKLNDFAVSVSGAAVATDTTGLVPVVSQLDFATLGSSNHIHSFQYFNAIKTNAQLQALSTP